MVLIILLFFIISLANASPYNCTFLVNSNVSWMAVFNGVTATGTALYMANGSLVTYSLEGEIMNAGTYKIEQGADYCYEYETYSYPPDAADTCNTYFTYEGEYSMMGCEILQDNCVPYENCTDNWTNWYAARLINYLD